MKRWSGEDGDEEEAKLHPDRLLSATPHRHVPSGFLWTLMYDLYLRAIKGI